MCLHRLALIATFLVFLFTGPLLFAQVPQKLNYQGIARDLKGNPLGNQTMSIKISVLPTDDAIVPEYEETQNITTNEFGLYSLQIGNGNALVGEMNVVKWETGNKYIRVAIDPKGGNDYSVIGTSQLLSVPYAIYADKAGLARETLNLDGKTRTGTVSSNAAHVAGDGNYITKFTALNTIGKSTIFDNGTNIGIGTASPAWAVHLRKTGPTYLTVQSDADNSTAAIRLQDVNGTASELGISKFGFNQTGTFMGVSRKGMGVINNLTGPFLFNVGGYCLFGQTVGPNQLVRMMIDSATGYIGIGSTIASPPTAILQVNKASDPIIKLSNTTSGTTVNDGLDFLLSGNNATINNRENGSIFLRTNNLDRIKLDATGKLGIGNINPSARLDISGHGDITTYGGFPSSTVARINDSSISTNSGSKIGLYSAIKKGGIENIGIYAETIDTTANILNIALYGRVTEAPSVNGLAAGIFALDAVDSDNTYAAYINGKMIYDYGATQSGAVLTSDANGVASWTAPCSFAANGLTSGFTLTAGNNLSPIIYNTESFDLSNNYNAATGVFTAPSNGVYHFDYSVEYNAATSAVASSGQIQLLLLVNGVTHPGTGRSFPTSQLSSGNTTPSGSATIYLNAGNTVSVRLNNATNATLGFASNQTYTHFSGYLIK